MTPPPSYDPTNVFARILRGEIPAKRVLETPHSLAFHDIAPQAPVHVLVIPKGAYVDHADFAARASEPEIVDFARAVAEVARQTGVALGAGGQGFRLVSNAGPDANQEVPHYHVHVCGGRAMGRILRPADA